MDIKKKIAGLRTKLKNIGVTAAVTATAIFPGQSGASITGHSSENPDFAKKINTISRMDQISFSDAFREDITMDIGELKNILEQNPDIVLSSNILESVQPGPSRQKIHSILSKGFNFTIRNSRGETKNVSCSLNQLPQGYCAGAIKRLLNQVYGEPISNNLSACQEKENLSKSSRFIAVPIGLEDVENCPPNTVVVIPRCTGHKHGHILIVTEKGVFCSDGKETAGEYFKNNYKDAQGIYAFIPVDGSIKLTPKLLQQSPELSAAVLSAKTGKDIQLVSGKKPGEPIVFAEKKQTPSQSTILAMNTQRNNSQ